MVQIHLISPTNETLLTIEPHDAYMKTYASNWTLEQLLSSPPIMRLLMDNPDAAVLVKRRSKAYEADSENAQSLKKHDHIEIRQSGQYWEKTVRLIEGPDSHLASSYSPENNPVVIYQRGSDKFLILVDNESGLFVLADGTGREEEMVPLGDNLHYAIATAESYLVS